MPDEDGEKGKSLPARMAGGIREQMQANAAAGRASKQTELAERQRLIKKMREAQERSQERRRSGGSKMPEREDTQRVEEGGAEIPDRESADYGDKLKAASSGVKNFLLDASGVSTLHDAWETAKHAFVGHLTNAMIRAAKEEEAERDKERESKQEPEVTEPSKTSLLKVSRSSPPAKRRSPSRGHRKITRKTVSKR